MYTILILMNATVQWLSLSEKERSDFVSETILPVMAEYPQVSAKFFDSEFFCGHVSDFMIVKTSDITAYQNLIEKLRATKIYCAPYFEIRDIIMGYENGSLKSN